MKKESKRKRGPQPKSGHQKLVQCSFESQEQEKQFMKLTTEQRVSYALAYSQR